MLINSLFKLEVPKQDNQTQLKLAAAKQYLGENYLSSKNSKKSKESKK